MRKSCKVIDGKRYIRVKGVRWFTNMDFPERYSDFNTDCLYSQDTHPYYDNSDIIDVCRLKDIPHAYQGTMGVPITFIDKYNPEQFEILGMRRDYNGKILLLNGKQPYCRIIIRSRKR